MSEGAYRDALIGLRQRVHELREDVEGLRRRVGWLLWASSDPAVRRRIEELRGRCAAAAAHAAGAAAASALAGEQAALQELARLYGALVASVPEVEATLRALPGEAPRPEGFHPWPARLSHLELDEVGLRHDAAEVLAHLERQEPHPAMQMGDDAVLRVALRRAGVPVGLALLKRHDPTYRGRDVRFAVEVHLPRLVPRFDVTVMHALGTIATSLGLLVDRRTGDDAFDTTFRVDGPEDATFLLGAEVRAGLFQLRDQGELRLRVAPGLGRLEWVGVPTIAPVEVATTALCALQASALHLGG